MSMSDKELLAQIAQVAGAINKHMNSSHATGYPYHPARGGYNGWGRGRGRGAPMAPAGPYNRSLTLNNSNNGSAVSTAPIRPPAGLQPFPAAKPAVRPPLPSRHLSLVNHRVAGGSNTSSTTSSGTVSPGTTPSPPQSSKTTIITPTTTATTPTATTTTTTTGATPTTVASSGQQWIQSKRKNLSLMSPALYKKTMAAREKSIQSSKEKKLKLRQARAKMVSDLRRGIVTVGGTEYNKSRDGRKLVMRDKSKDTIVINGVPFEMDPRGNKLVRKTNNSSSSSTASSVPVTTTTRIPSTSVLAARNAATPSSGLSGSTPKQFSIDGVVYVRTRSGNLVRASLVKELQKRATHKVKVKKMTPARKPRPFCQFFTRFGICSKGPTCPFVHSRNHLAICKKFLRGICPNTASTCKLSHTPSPHTTTTCSHFQRAACNKEDCLYPHIRINPQAPICRPFATLGWCEAGINCKDRHVWICPDFGTPAGCERKCGLAHVANGGIRVKKDSDEKRERDSGGANSSDHHMDSKRKRMDPSSSLAGWAKRTGRYMDGLGQDKNQEQDVNLNGSVKAKRIQYDENFVPLDFDDEEEKQVMMDQEQDQNERMEEFEQEEMDEEDEDDVSSDQVESEDEDEDEDDEDDDEDDEEMPEIEDEDDEDEDDAENEGLHEELQQFYDEQDRQDNDY